jgi:hypothetical protein
MAKSIVIELLQDRSDVRVKSIGNDGQLLLNHSFNNSSDWDVTLQSGACTQLWVLQSGYIEKTTTASCSYFHQNITLNQGHRYQVCVTVRNYDRSGALLLANHGELGANVTVFDGTTIPHGTAGNTSTPITIKKEWTQGNTQLDKLRFYSYAEMVLEKIELYQLAANDSAVTGALDCSTTEDFPLALTFQINDPDNIDARKGAYSKTFEIPATANNNQIFKFFNISNSTLNEAPLFDKIECRIVIDNLFSITGLLKVQDVIRQNNKPMAYSCAFFGDNLAWSTLLENQKLNEIDLENSSAIQLSAENVIHSWGMDNATSHTDINGVNTTTDLSPIVYPVATYGKTNSTGSENAMQLLRTRDEVGYIEAASWWNIAHQGVYGSNGGDPNIYSNALPEIPYTTAYIYSQVEPVNDWRPMVFVYKMIHKIFNNVGYRVVSNFIESDNFKQLLYASPNFVFNQPQVREQAYSYVGNFKDDSCAPADKDRLKMLHRHYELVVSGFENASNIQTVYQSQAYVRDVQFGGTCNSCTSGNCGSGRFQPAVGVITSSGSILQQELTVSLGGLGTAASPYYTMWRIPESGYYNINAGNIMYYLKFGNSDWGGCGNFGTSYTQVKLKGRLGVECKTDNEQQWHQRTSATEDDLQLHQGAYLEADEALHSFGGTFEALDYTGYFNKNDYVRIVVQLYTEMRVSTPSTNWNGTTSTSDDGYTTINMELELYGTEYALGSTPETWDRSNGYVRLQIVNPEIPEWGCTYNLGDVIPDDQKSLDFIRGLAHSFNWQFITNQSDRTVYIEPYNDTYESPTTAIDWTWKLARDMEDRESFIDNKFTRKMVFKYKTDDKDARVKWMGENYFEGILDQYPYIENLGDAYPEGTTTFENPFFAGTYETDGYAPITRSQDLSDPSLNFKWAAMSEELTWQNTKGIGFLPRLLYWNKMSIPTVQYPMWQGFTTQNNAIPMNQFGAYYYSANQVANPQVSYPTWATFPNLTNFAGAFYCSATFQNRFDYTNGFGLSYGDFWAKDYDNTTNVYSSSLRGSGLYTRYYADMISNYKKNPKKRVCYIDLKMNDVINLDFGKLYYIDGVYYRLIRVVDYKPHLNEPTRVELHEWSTPQGTSVPSTGIWINPNINTGGGAYNDDGSAPHDPYTPM